MTKLLITRHGETEWNLIRRMQGHLDSPLSELGVKQANWLKDRLEDEQISHIYSSPLGRAFTTATILKNNRKLPILKDDRLAEIDLGIWSGMMMEEIIAEDHINYDNFWNRPDLFHNEAGETFSEVTDRVVEFYNEVMIKHPDDNILVVAHAGVLKALITYLFYDGKLKDVWKHDKLNPASLTVLNISDGNVSIEMMADTSHYKEEREDEGWFSDIKR